MKIGNTERDFQICYFTVSLESNAVMLTGGGAGRPGERCGVRRLRRLVDSGPRLSRQTPQPGCDARMLLSIHISEFLRSLLGACARAGVSSQAHPSSPGPSWGQALGRSPCCPCPLKVRAPAPEGGGWGYAPAPGRSTSVPVQRDRDSK